MAFLSFCQGWKPEEHAQLPESDTLPHYGKSFAHEVNSAHLKWVTHFKPKAENPSNTVQTKSHANKQYEQKMHFSNTISSIFPQTRTFYKINLNYNYIKIIETPNTQNILINKCIHGIQY